MKAVALANMNTFRGRTVSELYRISMELSLLNPSKALLETLSIRFPRNERTDRLSSKPANAWPVMIVMRFRYKLRSVRLPRPAKV